MWCNTTAGIAGDRILSANRCQCRHLVVDFISVDTVYGPQWTHPHPSFSPSERWVIYCSDATGHPQVYGVDLDSLHTR